MNYYYNSYYLTHTSHLGAYPNLRGWENLDVKGLNYSNIVLVACLLRYIRGSLSVDVDEAAIIPAIIIESAVPTPICGKSARHVFMPHDIKARLHMRLVSCVSMRFCLTLPRTGIWSRNAATKYRQVSRNWKEGCLQIICDNFLFNPRDASWREHSCRLGYASVMCHWQWRCLSDNGQKVENMRTVI